MKKVKQAIAFVKAIAKYGADSFRNVDASEYNTRLSICQSCPVFENGVCTHCGCNMALKARMRSSVCPMEKWPPA